MGKVLKTDKSNQQIMESNTALPSAEQNAEAKLISQAIVWRQRDTPPLFLVPHGVSEKMQQDKLASKMFLHLLLHCRACKGERSALTQD